MKNPNTITVQELKQHQEHDPALCLIDVRELEEWQEARIPGAQHVPKDILTQKIEHIAPDKQQPVYLHCKGGVRSWDAAVKLLEMGYANVYSVEGGLIAWANAGYTVNT